MANKIRSDMALTASIGVCAYNEGRNIRRTLDSILSQRTSAQVKEVIVVSSGSTDDTDSIVREVAAGDARVRLIRQESREGKNSAVNAFMSQANGEVMVLVNADNILKEGCLEALLAHFQDPKVGVVGAHPLPVNPKDTVSGFAVNMLWDMHHRLALIYPKVGEVIAFRNEHMQIPVGMQSDEDLIRMQLEAKGLRTEYEPSALVVNKGPANVRDYIKQRTRVNIGERYMKKWFDYDIPTWDKRYLFQAYLSFLRENGDHPFLIAAAMCLEAYARAYATLHVALDRGDRPVWSMVDSTKNVE
jgi:cellulose synthase/poly-beta-1,6-N-acetylglucosamine synthase-like glycosyltransferase